MNEHDFLLLSSKSAAFPMAIQEAMALGMIVISTQVGGIANHITHLANGILINGESDKEIVNQFDTFINMVITDTNLAENISKNAISYASDHFRFAHFKSSFLNLIE
jgi:glycosyltransferase involved in cell wall biosynthesis